MSFTTLDPATISVAVTLSNGNTTAANAATSGVDGGAKGLAADALASGKFYFEWTSDIGNGGDNGIGIGTPASTYPGLGASATVGALVFRSGSFYVNGTSLAGLGVLANGNVLGFAVDFTNHLIWAKNITQAGLWNASGTANPATGIGGFTLPSGSFLPAVSFSASTTGQATLNAGASSFIGAVPSGFTSGWPGVTVLLPSARAMIIG